MMRANSQPRHLPIMDSWGRPTLTFVFLFVAWFSGAVGYADEIAGIRSKLETKMPAWVGQKIELNIDLLSSTFFSGAPSFDLPEVDGVVILKAKGSPVVSSEKIDGETWSVQRHSFFVYSHRPGRFNIPAFSVRFGVAPAFGQPPEKQNLKTDPISFETKLPEGAEGLSLLISTGKLEVTQTWSPTQPTDGQFRVDVGDAITRTITLTADDVPGMALPPIVVPEPDLVSAYHQPSNVDDREDRGTLVGKRIESETYVCEKAGLTELPALSIPWWDIEAEELNRINLPGVKIEIAESSNSTNGAERAAFDDPSETEPRLSPREIGFWAVGFIAIALVVGFVWINRDVIKNRFTSESANQRRCESGLFERVQSAEAMGDATMMFNSVTRWLEYGWKGEDVATIDAFAKSQVSTELNEQIQSLFSAMNSSNTNWDGTGLVKELTRIRNTKPRRNRIQGFKVDLPDLNPGR